MRFVGVLLMAAVLLTGRVAGAQYRVDTWTPEDGLPQGSINGIAQTTDGFMWFATNGGLVRFDGTTFRIYDTTNTPELRSSRIGGVFVGEDGALWLSTEVDGVLRYRNGAFTTFTVGKGLPGRLIGRIGFNARGQLAGFDTAGGPVVLRNDTLVPAKEFPRMSDGISFIGQSEKGALWYRDTKGVHRFVRGEPLRHVTLPIPIINFIEDRKGRLWTRFGTELICVNGDRVMRYPQDPARLDMPGFGLHEDRSGTLWFTFGGNAGLLRLRGDTFKRFTTADGLPHNAALGVFEDREGAIWVGSTAGLARLTTKPIVSYGLADGLGAENTYPILQDRRGDVWIGGWSGLTRVRDGVFEPMAERAGVAGRQILSLYEDREGAIWIGMWGGGIRRWLDGKVTIPQPSPGVTRVFTEGPGGQMWIGGQVGIARYKNGGFESITSADGYAGGEAFALHMDRRGVLWIGNEQGLSRYDKGVFTALGPGDGFSGRRVRAIYEDREGTLWFGSYDTGLFRYRDGVFTQYTRAHGLPATGAFQFLEDDASRFWISSNTGIYRVSKADLNAVAAGERKWLNAVIYGRSDGMPTQECNGAGQPAGIRARDGRMWFPTQRGVAVFDPSFPQQTPPPVLITDLTVGGVTTGERTRVEVRGGTRTFEATYTAVTFVRPELARFKYRMEGLDEDWVEAGDIRTARYAQLPYGSFTFRVLASNRDGAWNEEGAAISVVVVRPFWRTNTFAVIVMGAVMLAGAGISRWRLQVVRRNAARQAAQQEQFAQQLITSQETDRKRIASGLHDGVSQSLYVIRNWAAAEQRARPDDDQARTGLAQIEETAVQALGEVRGVVEDLVPYHLDAVGLSSTIRDMAARVGSASGMTVVCELAELDDALAPQAQIGIFRIVQEALNNVVKHSGARAVRIGMTLDMDTLLVEVTDDGRGFVVAGAAPDGDSKAGRGGFGTQTMVERARMLGGQVVTESAPGAGTTVRVTVPIDADGSPA